MMNLFAYEFAALCRRCLSFTRVFSSALDRFAFGHRDLLNDSTTCRWWQLPFRRSGKAQTFSVAFQFCCVRGCVDIDRCVQNRNPRHLTRLLSEPRSCSDIAGELHQLTEVFPAEYCGHADDSRVLSRDEAMGRIECGEQSPERLGINERLVCY